MSEAKHTETFDAENPATQFSPKQKPRERTLALRKIDWYLLKSFVLPFIAIFFVTLFVLIMQFLWKYVDDLVGKGLSWFVIGQLLFYASASMVPLALPLATLLASMMTMGNLAEFYELTSFKSSGISLWRICRSLLMLSIVISGLALLFANYALPVANLKFGSLLYDIRQQRPALNIKQGVFYKEIEGYSIRVGKKDADNRTIHDILIYDHTSGKGDDYVITAKKGEMYLTPDKRFLVLQLYDGNQFQELSPVARPGKKYEQVRVSFKEWQKLFDLSEFSLSRTDERLFKDNYQMQNIRQLKASADTLKMDIDNGVKNAKLFDKPYYTFVRVNLDSVSRLPKPDSNLNRAITDSSLIYGKALTTARNVKGFVEFTSKGQEGKVEILRRYLIELQRKFTLSVACFILFIIGAALGAIIRKGGFGLPFVVSVLFFIIFYMLSVSGEKMAREGVLSPFWGMWFSTIILLPIGIFLFYQANRDSAWLNLDAYVAFFRRKLRTITWFRESDEK
ncbi:MAG: LptF/LptG family permease [Chitinophagales bacterium]